MGFLNSTASGPWLLTQRSMTSPEMKRASSRNVMSMQQRAPVCAMGAVNHQAINHTTGQGKLQELRSPEYPGDSTSSAKDKWKRTTVMLYAAAHPTSKHNMLFSLDEGVKNISAAWVPGLPMPVKG